MVVLVKCWVKCTYLLSLLFLYIFPKMCTCIIITIPNFRGNLCNKYSLSIYFCGILCLFFYMQYESWWVRNYNHLQLDICPSAIDVPFGMRFAVLRGAAAIYLGSRKELFVWNNLCLNLLSRQLWMSLAQKATGRWEDGPGPPCLTSHEENRWMHKAAVPALVRTSVPRLTCRAGCHTSRAFVVLLVQVTMFVPICPVTICFLSLWAAAQE